MAHVIQVCTGSSCFLKGASDVIQEFRKELEKREANNDVLFELIGSFCQDSCADGPVVKVNGELYKHVTVADVPKLIETCLKQEG